MSRDPLVLGIDLGTSGVRLAVINFENELIHTSETSYQESLESPEDWTICCTLLIKNIPKTIKEKVVAIAVDGTSGTLLACERNGTPLQNALPYSLSCPEQESKLKELVQDGALASSTSSSLARALRLIDHHGEDILLRHQADWISGWLINDWTWGEEGNNLRLGWNLINNNWPQAFSRISWKRALPKIVKSGSPLLTISSQKSKYLSLPPKTLVVSGTTDSNAAVLGVNPGKDDGVTILGSTIVLKRFVECPIIGSGITNHRIGENWLCGGASNAGGALLKQIFSDEQLKELSRQINPETESGLMLRPLPFPGERFPVDDPKLQPILTPRPISDSLYLHGLLEGLAKIEAQGWERLVELGAPKPKRVITIGGGAKNPQWRKLRERILEIPIHTSKANSAKGVARLAIKGVSSKLSSKEQNNSLFQSNL